MWPFDRRTQLSVLIPQRLRVFDQHTSVPTASANMSMEQSAAQWPHAMQQFQQSQQHVQAQTRDQGQVQQQAAQGAAMTR
jgi:hypothetical protein